ncbi:hypothetical protein K9U33_17270 [Rhodoblastus acidophilus]|uniref:hypothetical protein n=1 Tax=Candidatus Rhodoblastus alkanivorans TaxID=2954117 RepID=UPI001FAAD023|nr:hypothetical protein [Candidatus Rhodoblastus alkanivorans]MCI4680383.1 hypothetical protein [Candidatus Rhodoblastus alkanivorans]
MTEAQEQLARIGAAITHAETLQKQAETAHRTIVAQTLSLQKSVAQLLVGIEERSNGLGAQEERLATQIAAFTKQVEQLGPQAFAGGKAAVAGEVRAALKDAASVVGVAAENVTAPVRATLTASLAAIDKAQASLIEARERLSWRALGLIGATALGALMLAGAGGYAMIGWQRAEIAAAREELARLQEHARAVAATVEEMEEKGRALDAKGVRFPTDTCRDQKGKTHLCVEIDAQAVEFTSADDRRHYRIPKGF